MRIVFGLFVVMLVFGGSPGCGRPDTRVVVYCAQDEEFARGVFADFQASAALTIAPKFDTEANKSVSLATELEAEAGHPRCDLHWNNEILGSIRLARKGVYDLYTSPSATGFPKWSQAKDGTWQAFASRARVLIVNTQLVKDADRPKSILDLTHPRWKGQIALAKPQFGTTATQAACLFEVLGPDAAKAFYRGLKSNDVAIVPGNKQAATSVSEGRYAIGLTDTDDALIELNAGKPVVVVYLDQNGHPVHPRLGVLFIPNTVALVKGSPNPTGAKKLADFLLSRSTEAMLAEGGGFQIPLHPDVRAKLHPSLLVPTACKPMEVDFDKAADLWDQTQAFLRDEFAR